MGRIDFLRQLPYFADLPEEELRTLSGNAPERQVPAGQALIEQGTPGEALYVVVEGEFDVVRHVDGRDVWIGRVARGDVLGEMALLEGRPRNASAKATVDSRVIEISEPAFRKLTEHSSTALSMLHTVVGRMRELEARLRESEQQAAFGRIAAGLMHDLNNPAAAVQRSAGGIVDGVAALEQAAADLLASGASDVDLTLAPPGPPPPGPPPSDPLTRSDRAERLGTWLEHHGGEALWDDAATLVDAGWDLPALERATADVKDAHVRPLVRWLVARHNVRELADEIRTGAARISELVGAVKSHAYVGQTLVPDLDLNESIRQTLVVLRHRLRDVEVDLHLGELPRIEAYGSELNQVWTNLIDNAIDAMEGSGRITISTRWDGERVVAEITDDGPGIPSQIRSRIFQPFFTTKPPGQGTGLGLHTVYNTVARHGGDIGLDSEPGRTTFTVRLPTQLAGREG
ncbi:MAG: ATP-binding protein [Actinomycetota bacterium]|nr:ATP-binding protein [Actinomycetota bacterium]